MVAKGNQRPQSCGRGCPVSWDGARLHGDTKQRHPTWQETTGEATLFPVQRAWVGTRARGWAGSLCCVGPASVPMCLKIMQEPWSGKTPEVALSNAGQTSCPSVAPSPVCAWPRGAGQPPSPQSSGTVVGGVRCVWQEPLLGAPPQGLAHLGRGHAG